MLVELLSRRRAQHLDGLCYDGYLCIGSILEGANARAEVWDSEFMMETGAVLQAPRAMVLM